MNATKVRLSVKELDIVNSVDFILTKNTILEKTKDFLSKLLLSYQQESDAFNSIVNEDCNQPKISRGENYRGLPWIVLDYPRSFSTSSVFAVRTLFWWGNFFSITLHLAGEKKKDLQKNILLSLPVFAKKDFYICISEDQWVHHFMEDNYREVSSMTEQELENTIAEKKFLKIAAKISLEDWDKAEMFLLEQFREIMMMISGKDSR